jgi:hypothetical protein
MTPSWQKSRSCVVWTCFLVTNRSKPHISFYRTDCIMRMFGVRYFSLVKGNLAVWIRRRFVRKRDLSMRHEMIQVEESRFQAEFTLKTVLNFGRSLIYPTFRFSDRFHKAEDTVSRRERARSSKIGSLIKDQPRRMRKDKLHFFR